MANLKYGSTGDDVKKLQTALGFTGGDVDGIFGEQTQKAVMDYQKNNGLTVDGIAGKNTLDMLYGGGGSSGGSSSNGSSSGSAETTSATAPTWNYNPSAGTWNDDLNNTISQILNREKFSYDINSDAIYQQYKDQYVQKGNMAMMDTMGQAAAMTGGYGNSFAQTAGQQAYNQYLGQLNNVVPELYGMALDKYNQEGQALYDQAAILAQMDKTEYDRAWDEYTAQYGTYRDQVGDEQWQQTFDQTETKNNYTKVYNYMLETGEMPSAEQLEAAGMTEAEAKAILKANDPTAGYTTIYNTDGTRAVKSPYSSIVYYEPTIKMAQWYLGLKPTGVWNKECEDAAKAANFAHGLDDAVTAFRAAGYRWDDTKGQFVDRNGKAVSLNPNTAGGDPELPAYSEWGDGEGQTPGTYKYNSYDEAVAALNQSGYGDNTLGLMTKHEWSRRKSNGGTGDEVTLFDSYEEYLEYYVEYASVPLEDRTWTLEYNGGNNWFWGIDNDATVKDQFGHVYRLDDLVDAFVKSGMTKDQAKAKVKAIQSAVGA